MAAVRLSPEIVWADTNIIYDVAMSHGCMGVQFLTDMEKLSNDSVDTNFIYYPGDA